MTSPIINPAALEPLFAPHEEPNFHGIRAEKPGEPSKLLKIETAKGTAIVIDDRFRR